MRNTFYLTVLAIIATVLFSCRKPIEVITSPPPINTSKPDTSSYLKLSVSGVAASKEAVFALLSVETSGGQPLITNKKVALHRDQDVYLTDKIEITRGSYKLTKLLFTTSSDTALYAAPKAQTAKAPQVPVTLPLAVDVTKPSVNTAAIQVLPIGDTDAPESFGYTNEDFGYTAFIHLRATISIQVGTVWYDSLPGNITIDAVNAAGSHWRKEVELAGGMNEFSVPEKYASYQFEMKKWNTTDTKIMSRQQLQPNGFIRFSTSRNAKRLFTENSFVETAAGFITDSRVVYFYENGLLSKINYLHKPVDQSTLRLIDVYKFLYSNKLDAINRYDEFSNLLGSTAFTYQNGRISNILETNSGQSTGVAVSYSGTGDVKTIEADYLYSNGNTMNYVMRYRNGNKVSDLASSSKGGGESATYSYDDNINPYYQLGYPDLLFARTSKNNQLLQQRNYQGNIPSGIPYKYEYTYDGDGYPQELIVSYKGYTDQHLYRVKTQFVYQ